MADIMLEDGSGVPQPYENVETLEVDSPGGGTEKFVHESLIPEAYTHPSTHPASMITGLAPAATRGSFSDLFNKPFCDLKPVLEEDNLPFSPIYDQDLEVCAYQSSSYFDLVKGEMYRVMWDGEEYICKCRDIEEDVQSSSSMSCPLYLGRLRVHPLFAIFASEVEDTSEPFLVTVTSSKDTENGSVIYISGTTSSTHTVSITPVNAIKKLDAKYLPDTAATKQWVREFAEEALAELDIPGGSGGTAVTETEILPEQECVFVSDTPDDTESIFVYAQEGESDLLACLLNIEEGKNYTVVFDGTEYNCTAFDKTILGEIPAGTTVNGFAVLGNATIVGVPGAENTGEPFWIQAADTVETNDDGTSTANKMAAILIKPGIATESVTRTIRIYQKAESPIPDDLFVCSKKEFLPLTDIETQYFDAFGVYGGISLTDEATYNTWNSHTGTVIVNWDGEEYEVEMQNRYGENAVGNLVLLGASGNNEPFIIAIFKEHSGEAYDYIWMLASTTDTVSNKHTVSVSFKGETTLNIKYLPIMEGEDIDETVIFAEQTVDGFASATSKMYQVEVAFDETVVIGNHYTVTWDGIAYVVEAFLENETTGRSVLGNPSLIIEGATDTGEPFVIRVGRGYILIGTSDTAATSHAVSIVQHPITATIKPERIPGPPEFDLTAMGLPAIPLGNAYQQIECDTSDLRAALEKGPVKFRGIVNVGRDVPATFVGIPFSGMGMYQANSLAFFDIPMFISVIVDEVGVAVQVTALSTTTT